MKKSLLFSLIATIVCIFFMHGYLLARVCLTKRTDFNQLDFQKDSITNCPIHLWVHTDDTPVYDCFQNQRQVIKRLEFATRYKVVRVNYRVRKDREYWSLLVLGNADSVNKYTIVGWVSHKNLLTNSFPMNNLDTGIYQKALIKEADGENQRALKVFTHPSKNNFRKNQHGKQEGIEVRTVYYVYDFYPKTARNPTRTDTQRVLIAADDCLDTIDDKANLLIGWVNRKKISFWDTRTACEFKLHTRGKVFDIYGNSVFETENIETPLEYDELRNPIFEKEGNRYKIGAFARLELSQLGLRRNVENIKTGLEILFIIDGTRSMSVVFNATLAAVEDTAMSISKLAKNSNLEIPKFGLVFYRNVGTLPYGVKKDENGRNVKVNEPYCREESILYQIGSINRFLHSLRNQFACDADKTKEESASASASASMYKSIIEGLKNCQFETGDKGKPKKTRIVIHIGGAGDNGRGNYSYRDVSRALKKYHIYRYFSVNAGSSSGGFSKSVNKLSPGPGKAEHIKNLSDLRSEVIKLIQFSQKKSIEIKNQIDIISRGFAGSNQGRIGVISKEILEYARKIIDDNGIDPERIDAFQKYYEGWVDKETVKEYILVSRTDIENITKFLNDMTIQFDDNQKRRIAWEQSLRMILGDQNCEIDGQPIPLDKCNEMRNGIPIKAGFMKYKRNEFLNLNSSLALKVKCQAKMGREQFRAFLQNKYIVDFNLINLSTCSFMPKYEYDINGDGRVVFPFNDKNANMVDQYFFNEGTEQMAWLPIKHLDVQME